MPVNLVADGGTVKLVLEGVVTPEEVDRLHELIRANRGAAVDLSACEHIHTAALQLLLLLGIPVAALPEPSGFWNHFFTIQEECDP